MNIKKRDIVKVLTNKGFREDKSKKKHIAYRLHVNGVKTNIWTCVSHTNKKTIGDKIIQYMSKQLKLSKTDFIRLIDCSLTYKGYVQKLKEDGHLNIEYSKVTE